MPREASHGIKQKEVFYSEEREKNEGFHPSRAAHCPAHLGYFNRFSCAKVFSIHREIKGDNILLEREKRCECH